METDKIIGDGNPNSQVCASLVNEEMVSLNWVATTVIFIRHFVFLLLDFFLNYISMNWRKNRISRGKAT